MFNSAKTCVVKIVRCKFFHFGALLITMAMQLSMKKNKTQLIIQMKPAGTFRKTVAAFILSEDRMERFKR